VEVPQDTRYKPNDFTNLFFHLTKSDKPFSHWSKSIYFYCAAVKEIKPEFNKPLSHHYAIIKLDNFTSKHLTAVYDRLGLFFLSFNSLEHPTFSGLGECQNLIGPENSSMIII
jgi:hypothetical protein